MSPGSLYAFFTREMFQFQDHFGCASLLLFTHASLHFAQYISHGRKHNKWGNLKFHFVQYSWESTSDCLCLCSILCQRVFPRFHSRKHCCLGNLNWTTQSCKYLRTSGFRDYLSILMLEMKGGLRKSRCRKCNFSPFCWEFLFPPVIYVILLC